MFFGFKINNFKNPIVQAFNANVGAVVSPHLSSTFLLPNLFQLLLLLLAK
jgi:hypothetical protein